MKSLLKRSLVITVLLLPLLFSPLTPAHAEDSISVTGDAAVMVVPDEVILTFGIETSDKDLMTAKTQNDDRVKKLMDVVTSLGIDPKNAQTDFINIQPRYNDSYARRDFIGYFVQKTIVITLQDISKFEDLLTNALLAGVNYVHGIDFRTTELRKYRDQARSLAINAAREKAQALAQELGRQVTKPLSIQENRVYWWSSYHSWWGSSYGGMQSQNVVQNAGGGPSNADDSSDNVLSPGQITVSASVTVTFGLEAAK